MFVGSWSQAGGIAHHGFAGLFWKAIPKDRWPTDVESLDFIHEKWVEPFGDMRQELVFIGQGLDKNKIIKLLDECLLSKEDLFLFVKHWKTFSDPFPKWGVRMIIENQQNINTKKHYSISNDVSID